jgi:hypothetical protein
MNNNTPGPRKQQRIVFTPGVGSDRVAMVKLPSAPVFVIAGPDGVIELVRLEYDPSPPTRPVSWTTICPCCGAPWAPPGDDGGAAS